METRLILVCLGFPILVIESLSHINNRRKGLFCPIMNSIVILFVG